jgi:hypothetical protein
MEIKGKPVKDSKKDIVIDVQPQDCARGKVKDPAGCAAARAILREHPEVQGARVHRGITYLEYDTHWERHRTPAALAFELGAFDRGGTFEPGQHRLSKTAGSSLSIPAMRARSEAAAKAKKDKRGRHDVNKKKHTHHEIKHIRPRGANR